LENPYIAQGMIENSNVVPITEMTMMIAISRGYQTIQKMLETEHELQRKANKTLADSA
jgi:flagellar basal-body rod protein FlgF